MRAIASWSGSRDRTVCQRPPSIRASIRQSVPDLYGIGDDVYGGGKAVGPSIWLRQRRPGETGLYLGIVCDTNELVDAAYGAAIKAGAVDEGKPADRAYFAPGYYAANVADFDGNRLEFVHKAWNPKRHSSQLQPEGSASQNRPD